MTGRGRWLVGAVLAVQVFFLCTFKIHDPDTWWHLKTGQVIVETRSIPKTDIYSWTIEGKPWVTFEWLSQVAFYLLFKLGGPAALTGFKATVLAASFLLLWRLAGLTAGSAVLLGMTAVLTRGFFFERPQIFDCLLIPVYFLLLERKPGRRETLALAALSCLWTNLHGGAALIGVIMCGGRLAQSLLWEPEDRKARAAAAAAVLAAMLVNPHGYRIFTHVLETIAFPGKELIGEWAPLKQLRNWYGAYIVAALVAMAVRYREDFLLCFMTAGTSFMALRATRYLAFFMLAASPLLARAGQAGLEEPVFARLRAAWARLGELGQAGTVAAAIALVTWVYGEKKATNSLHMVGFGLSEPSKGAVEYLEKNDVQGRMYNEYGMGGYLIWKAWPKRKVFIDGRNVEYGPELVERSARWMKPGEWPKLVRDFDFDYAVIDNMASYNAWPLDLDKEWALVYWDDHALVYLRRGRGNDALIRRDAYRFMQPNRLSYGYLLEEIEAGVEPKAILAELDRAAAGTEANVNAKLMTAFLLDELGRHAEARKTIDAVVAEFAYRPGPYLGLGWHLERRGDLPGAAEAYEKGAEAARRQNDWVTGAVAWNNLGSVQFRRGDLERAEWCFKRALDLNPDFELPRQNLTKLRYERSKG